jgi:hypothetical protein
MVSFDYGAVVKHRDITEATYLLGGVAGCKNNGFWWCVAGTNDLRLVAVTEQHVQCRFYTAPAVIFFSFYASLQW